MYLHAFGSFGLLAFQKAHHPSQLMIGDLGSGMISALNFKGELRDQEID